MELSGVTEPRPGPRDPGKQFWPKTSYRAVPHPSGKVIERGEVSAPLADHHRQDDIRAKPEGRFSRSSDKISPLATTFPTETGVTVSDAEVQAYNSGFEAGQNRLIGSASQYIHGSKEDTAWGLGFVYGYNRIKMIGRSLKDNPEFWAEMLSAREDVFLDNVDTSEDYDDC